MIRADARRLTEGIDYARSDDSLPLTDDDDADVELDELVEFITAEGYTDLAPSSVDGDFVASNADSAAVPAALPDPPRASVLPAEPVLRLRRSSRIFQQIVWLTHPRPQPLHAPSADIYSRAR